MKKSMVTGIVIGGALLAWYLSTRLKDAANADTKGVTETTKGEDGKASTLTTTPIKVDPGFVAQGVDPHIPVYATPNLGSLTFRNVYDHFMPFSNPVSARADFDSVAPPEARPTTYIN